MRQHDTAKRNMIIGLAAVIVVIGLAAILTNRMSGASTTVPQPAPASASEDNTELKVAPVSLDTADAVLEFIAPAQLVAIPKSISNPYLAVNADMGKQAGNPISGATGLDPEAILSFQPDLVLLTKVHHTESDAEELLRQAGVNVITFDQWGTFEAVMGNYRKIGEAVGEADKGVLIAEEIEAKLQQAAARTAKLTAKPTVLVLSPVGPNTGPYVIGPGNIAYDMIRLAGANPAADALGIAKSIKASIEDLIKIDPDYIVLGDWDGTGEEWLAGLKADPQWNTLTAVQQGRITTMKARDLLAPNRYTVDGMLQMSAWLHPDLWKDEEADHD
ncbi:ABC transporter substrate-binding protein [Paenibacillus thiaminolyticus]|uniref:ABC transporter substrate-binding protein n=1 Tax=Paenibacillus thiaminolyticus TaxID=49283 RepID=A0AAP9DY15_PANTH|nr:ABC transporter substrate-binding protein [Paenibacillus thiaminolyticus]MCY9535372.1 ABC transporter substrate-binding protein [Paenibacillus thiaminolyticus]MCY9603351.1 ABC transporter substrate-binding protein [Paenibacillus thiaminolyticus]MCY9607406.1 ABC transporter substrate-binding protein [Paenibacillus thiaminolyticus]MCY9616464.1 ABC transporter substrate-binding protein [Paenibacillus thiaminolyticus]MCY9621252.1 ABC transporter substrate-binding protein [Paenibacillus thiamino